jgi:NADP-dependent 3-hydroxy acid dehydrogenase YdfG
MPHPAFAAGRTAVITGAASGIGRAAAARFAGMGLNVLMADRSAEALRQAAAGLGAGVRTEAIDRKICASCKRWPPLHSGTSTS